MAIRPTPPKVDVAPREYGEMRTVLGLDAESLESGKAYRWVNRSAVKVARARLKGYRIVSKDSGVVPLIEVENGADGSIIAGDLVLMETDKARYKARKASEVDLAIERTKRSGDDVLERGKRLGVKTRVIDDDDDED